MVSVVLPVYNERPNLAPLLDELSTVLRDVPHEIIAVDDGSTDGSRAELVRLRAAHPRLRVVCLAANAGQSAAIAVGFDAAHGDVVATLDADGQNDPTDLLTLVERLRAEPTLAAVVGYRVRRADTRWKVVQSRIANAVRNRITGDVIRDTGCPLKALRRDVAQRLPRFDGMHRFIPTLIRVQGGTVIEMPVSHRARRAGASKYGMRDRALRGLTDALAVRWYRRRALDYEITEEIA